MKALSYLRVSGKAQLAGDGFPRQRIAIEAFASAAGVEIIGEFTEEGVSGKTEWDDRPAWTDMMLAIAANGIKTIVIERLDRLARDLMVQEHIIADLKKRGITLLSTAEPDLGSEEPSRVLLRQIMGAISAYDRASIVLKLRGARNRIKAKKGRCEGRKPFGWHEEERPALLMMRDLRTGGQLFSAITEELNRAGYRTRSGGEWIESTVAAILRREAREKAKAKAEAEKEAA